MILASKAKQGHANTMPWCWHVLIWPWRAKSLNISIWLSRPKSSPYRGRVKLSTLDRDPGPEDWIPAGLESFRLQKVAGQQRLIARLAGKQVNDGCAH